MGWIAGSSRRPAKRGFGRVEIVRTHRRQANVSPTRSFGGKPSRQFCYCRSSVRIRTFDLREAELEQRLGVVGGKFARAAEPGFRTSRVAGGERGAAGDHHRRQMIGTKSQTGASPDPSLDMSPLLHRDRRGQLVCSRIARGGDGLADPAGDGTAATPRVLERTGRRKDGSEFPVEIIVGPLSGESGNLRTAAIRDITARKQAEAVLLQKLEELNRSNMELEQFAAIASHDLQEPLRIVAGYTQLLSRRYQGRLDADAEKYIAFAVDGATRMQQLIQDMLAYSRVGAKTFAPAPTAAGEALESALSRLRGAIEESHALITYDTLPSVLADPRQLTQLFQNLVGNAIKYHGGEPPVVHISAAEMEGGKWRFSVRDLGIGIDPQHSSRIFGMFQRLHSRQDYDGTGIGLAICKKIVDGHGGAIWVESKPGAGADFRFTLPAVERCA